MVLGVLALFLLIAFGLFFLWTNRKRWRELLRGAAPYAAIALLALVIVYVLLALSFGGMRVRLL